MVKTKTALFDPLLSSYCCFTYVFKSNHVVVQEGEFPGLIPLMESYLSNVDVDIDTRCTISQYLKLISRRASGE